jgi:hypothetical protein
VRTTAASQATDTTVLQIDEQTDLSLAIPAFDMRRLTWSFWVKFANLAPGGWPGSVVAPGSDPDARLEIKVADLTRTLPLVDYDHDSFAIAATNLVTAIAGFKAQADAAEAAVQLATDGRALADGDKFAEAAAKYATLSAADDSFADAPSAVQAIDDAKTSSNTAATDRTQATSTRTQATSTRTQATSTRTRATSTRTQATSTRARANQAKPDSDEAKQLAAEATRLENEATRLENEATRLESEATRLESEALSSAGTAKVKAKSAEDSARAAREAQLDRPRYETMATQLKVTLGGSDDSIDLNLGYGVWHHVAVTLERSANSYAANLYVRAAGAGADTTVAKSFSVPTLAPQRTLTIGRQPANFGRAFAVQMSEFQLWEQARDAAAIAADRQRRRARGLFSLPLDARVPLSQNLFTGGIDKLLSPESQQAREIDFWQMYSPPASLVPAAANRLPATIDFRGAHGLYHEELFFHIPLLIANQLNKNQKFAEAQQWYHYIFKPTAAPTPFQKGVGAGTNWPGADWKIAGAGDLNDDGIVETLYYKPSTVPSNGAAIVASEITIAQAAGKTPRVLLEADTKGLSKIKLAISRVILPAGSRWRYANATD